MQFLLAIALLGLPLQAAVITGCVRDASDHPVAGAEVYLNGQPTPVRTDAQGYYRFEKVAPGTYSVGAKASGSNAASLLFVLDEKETRQVNLVLQPEFFDEPSFVVAGVTAGNYQGGHGSDVVLRSTEQLSKELGAKLLPKESLESIKQAVARDPNNAELHHQLAGANESHGNFLEALREYQRAAELNPNETKFLDWGLELLSHQADLQATEVFTTGNRLHPDSVRMLLGLATAWYARGSYDQAAKCFYAASDLDPANPKPYHLLGEVRVTAITQTQAFVDKMERFARLHPDDAEANYSYAASLWSNRTDNKDAPKVERLLQKAIQLEPKRDAAYLTLGIVYSDLKQFPEAIDNLKRAAFLEEAHYRLALVYHLTGQTHQAHEQLKTYNDLAARHAKQIQKERNEVQLFVFSLRTQ